MHHIKCTYCWHNDATHYVNLTVGRDCLGGTETETRDGYACKLHVTEMAQFHIDDDSAGWYLLDKEVTKLSKL